MSFSSVGSATAMIRPPSGLKRTGSAGRDSPSCRGSTRAAWPSTGIVSRLTNGTPNCSASTRASSSSKTKPRRTSVSPRRPPLRLRSARASSSCSTVTRPFSSSSEPSWGRTALSKNEWSSRAGRCMAYISPVRAVSLSAKGLRRLGREPPGEHELGDLDRVQRRTLPEVVARQEERETVSVARAVRPDPAHQHLVLACCLPGRGDVLEPQAPRLREQLLRVPGRERLERLDPDRLGVPDQDRNAHAGRADGQLRQLEDLARLLADLGLLVELLAVEVPRHLEVELVGRRLAEALHPLRPGAGGRLVRRHAHPRQPRRLV